MTVNLWLAFVAASAILLIIPGPTILLAVSYGLARGRRCALRVVTGVVLGDLVAMVVSLAGLGAVLATSATAFTALKWIGACYLVYLGVRMWRARPTAESLPAASNRSDNAMMAHAFTVTVLNPKSIAFFGAFLPQFITPAAPVLPQMVLLGGTFLALATAIVGAYALLAGSARAVTERPSVLKAVNRLGGGMLIGAGLVTAALRRPA